MLVMSFLNKAPKTNYNKESWQKVCPIKKSYNYKNIRPNSIKTKSLKLSPLIKMSPKDTLLDPSMTVNNAKYQASFIKTSR